MYPAAFSSLLTELMYDLEPDADLRLLADIRRVAIARLDAARKLTMFSIFSLVNKPFVGFTFIIA